MLLCLGRNAILRQCLIADRWSICRYCTRYAVSSKLTSSRGPTLPIVLIENIYRNIGTHGGSNYRLASHGTVCDQAWSSLLSSVGVCCLFDQDVLILSRPFNCCVHTRCVLTHSLFVQCDFCLFNSFLLAWCDFIWLNIDFGKVPFSFSVSDCTIRNHPVEL